MCTAYEIGKQRGSSPGYLDVEAVAEILAIKETRIIRPTLPAPVIMPNGSLRTMLWGFRLQVPGAKGKMRTVVNSREDKLDGRTWNKAFRERRCLIPATAFYEWVDGKGGKVPLRFERPGGAMTFIAGIWRMEEERGECFSMITTEPTDEIAPIHDRMPAVLADSQISPFLAGELNVFGPSAVPLQFKETANFLKKEGPGPRKTHPPEQGELF